MTDKPRRTFDISIHIGADTWPDALRALNEVVCACEDRGPKNGNVICGGPTFVYLLEVDHDPSITHESYFAAVEAWRAKRRATKPAAGSAGNTSLTN